MNYTTRLEPIENPAGFYMKAAYFFCRRMLGKVIMPLKVIYARKPALLRVSLLYQKIEEHRISLPATLRLLVKSVISLKNSCTFCNDLALALAVQKKLGLEKFRDLENFRASAAFSDAEKAALAYTLAVAEHNGVPDRVFSALRLHFSEEQVVELTWLAAVEVYYNTLSRALNIESDNLLA
ncbi:MAG: carboxymuconolactone decarboxylase family protein [Turneriella sp.]